MALHLSQKSTKMCVETNAENIVGPAYTWHRHKIKTSSEPTMVQSTYNHSFLNELLCCSCSDNRGVSVQDTQQRTNTNSSSLSDYNHLFIIRRHDEHNNQQFSYTRPSCPYTQSVGCVASSLWWWQHNMTTLSRQFRREKSK